MAICLYGSKFSSPCRTVLMAIKHLKLDFNLKAPENKEWLQSPEFLKINPAHCIPTIVDGDLTLWESRAILQYLFNKYAPESPLYPKNPKKRAVIDRTLNFDMSYFNSIRVVLFSKLYNEPEPTEQQKTNLKNNLKLLETLIGRNKYVAGNELTIADLAVVVSTTLLGVNDFTDLDDVPNVRDWFDRIQNELPYFEEVNGGATDRLKQMLAQK